MCGIAGKLHWGQIGEDGCVSKMMEKIIHRGPDASGIVELEKITLGHRRLSIIDLSAEANQPMKGFTGRFYITYNGEIYNYREIRAELERSGCRFNTQSDTEVILNAYEQWGEECLGRFNGMWAFAIWDSEKNELFAARDRFGKKPFYYAFTKNKGLSFCSELTGLILDEEVGRTHSMEAFNCYLALGYIPAPLTMYENVFKLEHGSYMKITDNGEKVQKKKYWEYAEFFRKKTNESEDEIAEHIRYLLAKSVKYRLISDVPVGAFLSGGIDSGSIVSYVKKIRGNDFHTFSIGFKYDSYSELEEAGQMAEFLKTVHHGKVVEVGDNMNLILEAVDGFDELFADNSLIPMNEVSKLASNFVKVVLSGDGADELFAGYDTYKADSYFKFISMVPFPVRKLIFDRLNRRNMDSGHKIGFQFRLRQFLNGSFYNADKAHYMWRLFFDVEDRVKILGEKYRELVNDTDPFRAFEKYYKKAEGLDLLDRNLYVDCMTWLPDDILVKVDRTTMQSSIEARAPFLDVNLAEYAASIPSGLKMKGRTTKYILKKALKGIVPDKTLYRRKSGFNAPVGKWIENSETDEFRNFNKFVFKRKVGYAEKTK